MREIVQYPDPVLTTRCREVTDDELKARKAGDVSLDELVADLTDCLYQTKNGVGLAAPQVGVSLRVFIMGDDRSVAPIVIFNPVLSKPKGEVIGTEGCLSIPGVEGKVKRAESITITGKRPDGSDFEFRAESLMARVAQHETDHLDGVLFINKLGMSGINKVADQLAVLRRQYAAWKARTGGKP